MKRFSLWISHIWRPVIDIILAAGAIGALLFYRLYSLVPQFSAAETATRASSSSLRVILKNPLFAPYKLLQYGLIRFHYVGPLAMRSVSALFGAFTILMMYYVLKRWHSARIALLGVALFACSSWFLHYARLATPSITYSLLFATLAYGTWIRHTKRAGLAMVLGALLITSLIYTPGLIWFVILGVIWQWDTLLRLGGKAPKLTVVASLALVVLLVPLGFAIYHDINLLRVLAGLPSATWPTVTQITKNVIHVGDTIFMHGGTDPMVALTGLALLDVFTIAMLVIGIYAYVFMRKLDRIKMLIGTLVLGVFLIGLGGSVATILLAPFIYVIGAAGVAWLLEQWFTVFPRNPLVRGIGLGLMIIAVASSCWYQLDRYFIAWPHASATKQVFRIKS